MKQLTLPQGKCLPALGLGTWRMGEDPAAHDDEVAAVRLALDLGYRVIDTAEMYGDGGAESLLGEAIGQALRDGVVSRDQLFIVSKVYPHNASVQGTAAACERSLRRLGLDHVDLYLLHWRGEHPLAQTVQAFEALQRQGRIRHWGVSNFDLADMLELHAVRGGAACSANQVYYSLSERGIEHSLLPWQRAHDMPVMAYCPIDQGALAARAALRPVAERHGITPAQAALAWVMSQPGVMAIPKAVQAAHLRDNLAAARVELDDADHALLDRVFPPPKYKRALTMR
jgi:diketogulonate reductase-like aldo/keto reductase